MKLMHSLTDIKLRFCRCLFLADTGEETLFLDTIKELYNIKTEQDDDFPKEFADLDDDDITELILTVEATVVFNDKNAKQVIQ